MLKKSFSILLLLVFTSFIVAPSIVTLMDENVDISMFFDVNEEENNEKESEKDVKIKILQIENAESSLIGNLLNGNRRIKEGHSKHYPELHSPPPELS